MSLTPEQTIKMIILQSIADSIDYGYEYAKHTGEEIDELFDDPELEDEIYETKYEIREGEVETDIPSEYSRHYESKSVATQAPNGQWVGWTYWYGGGKHGEPEAIDWMEYAYFLDVKEEEKLVVVRTFTKKG